MARKTKKVQFSQLGFNGWVIPCLPPKFEQRGGGSGQPLVLQIFRPWPETNFSLPKICTTRGYQDFAGQSESAIVISFLFLFPKEQNHFIFCSQLLISSHCVTERTCHPKMQSTLPVNQLLLSPFLLGPTPAKLQTGYTCHWTQLYIFSAMPLVTPSLQNRCPSTHVYLLRSNLLSRLCWHTPELPLFLKLLSVPMEDEWSVTAHNTPSYM